MPLNKLLLGLGLVLGLLVLILIASARSIEVPPSLDVQEQKVNQLTIQLYSVNQMVSDALRDLVNKQNRADQLTQQLQKERQVLEKMRAAATSKSAPAPAEPSMKK